MIVCNKCSGVVTNSSELVSDGYSFYCFECDEDLYSIETHIEHGLSEFVASFKDLAIYKDKDFGYYFTNTGRFYNTLKGARIGVASIFKRAVKSLN